MAWIALSHQNGCQFDRHGLSPGSDGLALIHDDALMVRGSLVIETRLLDTRRPEPLLLFAQGGDWPIKLELRAVPGGGVNLVLEQAGSVLHHTLNQTDTGRADLLRLTYSWDSPRQWGRLALERVEDDQVQMVDLRAPRPWRLADLQTLLMPGPFRYTAPEVQFIALSDQIEPVGPMPTLDPETPIATPDGYRALSDLQRGDLVLTGEGRSVPVLQVLRRQVPTCGSFRPIQLRAPYFGLQRDITVAPAQRLVLSGSEVEYLFGHQSVLVPARHLTGTHTAFQSSTAHPVSTYLQLLLPDHDAPLAAGAVVESMFIGRLRRNRAKLAASLLGGIGAQGLPEHGQSKYPVLKAFDATILAERRVA